MSDYHALITADEGEETSKYSTIGRFRRSGDGGVSTRYLIVLTCSTGGLQVVWSLIMSNGTPFLLTLGMPSSLTALLWGAAPLCGFLVQPYVGVMSDRCQSPWGRRKPFILGGVIGCVICMLGLAITKPCFHLLAQTWQWNIKDGAAQTWMLLSAITWIIGLDLCIQPLQAGIRALIVDNCPARQQAEAHAWASRITGFGNLVGYLFGCIPVHSIMPLIDMSQFSWLCIVASLILSATVGITCVLIQEKDPSSLPASLGEGLSFLETVKHIVWSAQALPYSISEVFRVQFFAWMGWFPYLFYISSYVGDLYAAPRLAEDINMSSTDQAKIIEDAVRLGSFASLVFASFALLTCILLPIVIERSTRGAGQKTTTAITTAWTYTHLIFSISMFSTIFVTSQTTAIVLAAFVGVSWAGTLWIPFALIGKDVAARNELNAHVLEGELEPAQQDQAGAIMGLHNSAISAPQIIAAFTSGVIFWLVPRDGLGWVMRFGGCSTLAAAWFSSKMEAR
ncbi:hypothetical protein E6O75_ATG09073 [Venturia nashicola]|uniref:MFS general substrate transporter n=1 Tax=Venturia nashicola TaxID=86259 RepID=A0A4Z1NK90_9PEZI|nr:hypothetical protein E6O75_ATG09073 [Venturia nashicola]